MSKFKHNDADDVAVVKLNVPIVDGEFLPTLRDKLFELVDDHGRPKILLDCEGVIFVSSAVIGMLITLHKKVEAVQGRLVLCNVNAEMIEVFEATKLTRLFTVLPTDMDDGLRHFTGNLAPRPRKDAATVVLPFRPIEGE